MLERINQVLRIFQTCNLFNWAGNTFLSEELIVIDHIQMMSRIKENLDVRVLGISDTASSNEVKVIETCSQRVSREQRSIGSM
jgi:hypothetical protein